MYTHQLNRTIMHCTAPPHSYTPTTQLCAMQCSVGQCTVIQRTELYCTAQHRTALHCCLVQCSIVKLRSVSDMWYGYNWLFCLYNSLNMSKRPLYHVRDTTCHKYKLQIQLQQVTNKTPADYLWHSNSNFFFSKTHFSESEGVFSQSGCRTLKR